MTEVTRPSRTLLIIDDDPLMLTFFDRFLTARGFTCRVAVSAADGVDALRLETPEAVLCDLQMPGASGLDFLKAVRAEPEWATLPVAILTGDLNVSPDIAAEVERLNARVKTGVIPRGELVQLVTDLCHPPGEHRRSSRLVSGRQPVGRAASGAWVPHENSALHKIGDVAERRVRRALRQSRPLRRCEVTLETVEQTIEDQTLAFVERRPFERLPDARLVQHRRERSRGRLDAVLA